MENYLLAIKTIDGGLKKVARRAGIHQENVKRNLRGQTNDPGKVVEACLNMLHEELNNIYKLVPELKQIQER